MGSKDPTQTILGFYALHLLGIYSLGCGLTPHLELPHSVLALNEQRVQSLAAQREKLTEFPSAGVEHHCQSKNQLDFIYLARQNVYWEQG